jgi:hypothetical protein
LSDFNDWILQIGNGSKKINIISEIEECPDTNIIEIPQDLLLTTTGNKMQALVESTYPNFLSNYNNPEYIKNRAILATTNDIVEDINSYMLNPRL